MDKHTLRAVSALLLSAVFFTAGYFAGERIIKSDPLPVYESARSSDAPAEDTPTPSTEPEKTAAPDIYEITLCGSTLSFYKHGEILMQGEIIPDSLPYDDISRLEKGVSTSDFEQACGVWESVIG